MRWMLLLLLVGFLVAPISGQDEVTVLAVKGGTLETRANLPEVQSLQLQEIVERLDETLRGKEIGLVASRWDGDGQFLYRVRYNDAEPYAIASTFKAFAAFYYFMTIPQADWNNAPGSNVYNMVVFSDNRAAGNLLAETAEAIPGSGNPIEKFNDFMQNTFGLSDHSGINAWDAGALANQQLTDDRYAPDLSQPGRYVMLYGAIYTIRNRFTARDAATAIEMLATIPFDPDADEKERAAYLATRTLMSVSDPRYPTNFDAVAFDGGSWRKYGYLSEGDAGAEARSEIVVIPAADGGQLVITMLSGAEPGDSFRFALSQTFRELAAFDHTRLINTLPLLNLGGIPRATPVMGRWNYGFVLPVQLNIYREADENSELIENPLRPNMLFPVAAVYQGALVRFTPVDSSWGKLEWNTNAPPFRGTAAYIRLSDVYVVPDALFSPVRQVIAWETPPRKFIVVDKSMSHMHLIENDRVVFTTPVILNARETLDGEFGTGTRRISDSHAGFPFVAFSTVYVENGQSIYPAPWHNWSQTYTQYDSRYSPGDILVPDWFVNVPGWGRARADIFIFRWLGGFDHPGDARVQAPQSQILLMIVRSSLDDLLSMTYPDPAKNDVVAWQNLIQKLDNSPVIAPDSFFQDASTR